MFKLTLITLAALAVVDSIWLLIVARSFYAKQIGHLMAASPSWTPVLIFYPLFAVALTYFAIQPGIASGSMLRTVLLGAAFGGIAYATYDLTNHATLKDWPLAMTLVDIAWGAFLAGTVAGSVFIAHRLFFKRLFDLFLERGGVCFTHGIS